MVRLSRRGALDAQSVDRAPPDLTAEGARPGRTIAFEIRHLKCPSCVTPGSPMPPFASQGPANLKALATFLVASKGGK